MPYRYGNYYEPSFIESFFTGLCIIFAVAVILFVPGLISWAVWGWHWLFPSIGIFWLGAMGLWLIVGLISFLGNPD